MNLAYDGVIATGAWPFVVAAYAVTAAVLSLYAVRLVRSGRAQPPPTSSREDA